MVCSCGEQKCKWHWEQRGALVCVTCSTCWPLGNLPSWNFHGVSLGTADSNHYWLWRRRWKQLCCCHWRFLEECILSFFLVNGTVFTNSLLWWFFCCCFVGLIICWFTDQDIVELYMFVVQVVIILFVLLQPISNADFIVPVEIDGTVHQVNFFLFCFCLFVCVCICVCVCVCVCVLSICCCFV